MRSEKFSGKLKMIFFRGILVVLPVFITIFLLVQLYDAFYNMLSPIAERISDERILGISFPVLAVIIFLTLIIFITGMIVSRPKTDGKLSRMIELLFPRYYLIRGMFSRKIDNENEDMKPCLVYSDDCWVFAFIMDEVDDEMFIVYMPSTPSVSSGVTCIKYKDQVRPIDSTVEEIARALIRFGKGGSRIISNKMDWSLPGK